ncbi:MAG: ATPase P [Chthoniobacterales bacterium]
MIKITIPGFRDLKLTHLLLDYNGTLAIEGILIPGVGDALKELSSTLKIHVLTGDTFGTAKAQLKGLPIKLTIAPNAAQAESKVNFITDLGVKNTVAIGNGRNDRKMLKAAVVGIVLIQKEGASAKSVANADIVCTSILDALGMLKNPKFLNATLRS